MPGPLDEYLGRIVSDQDRILFQEAACAAAAGANRAAYIMAWVSCAESLKRKFRELSARDAQATKVTGEIARKEAAQHSIDKYVLDEAKEYGFVTETEYTRLAHVYSMRCLFGHPYEVAPTREELLSAAAVVTEVVLSRPTKLRHGFLTEQVRLLATERTFLDDLPLSVHTYAAEVHGKAADDLHLWFLQKLWKDVEPLVGDPSMQLLVRRGVWFSQGYLRLCLPAALAEWNVTGDVLAYPVMASQVLAEPALFAQISVHAQDVVVGKILEHAQGHASHLRALEVLYQAQALTPRQTERFLEGVHAMNPSVLATIGMHPAHFTGMLIDQLKTYNWYAQAPAVEVLRNMGPAGIGLVAPEVQYQLGNNVLQAAEGNSNAAVGFLQEIALSSAHWPPDFLFGIFAEVFINEHNQVRFKVRWLDEVLRIVAGLPGDVQQGMVAQLAARIANASVKYPRRGPEERNRITAILHDPDGVPPGSVEVLAPLCAALEGLAFEENEQR